MISLSDFHVGQKVIIVEHFKDSNVKYSTVEKVGRKYITVSGRYSNTFYVNNEKDNGTNGADKDGRCHPTQKPIQLYYWVFDHYAKKGDKILDTHLGSGSSRIAAYKAGLDFVGCEIDKTCFDLQEERFKRFTDQQSLFY